MDNIIDMSMSAEDTQSIGSLIWQPIRFEQSKLSSREDGCCALVQLVRPSRDVEYHKYTIVYQRRMDPERPELRFGHSVQCYVLFDHQYDNIDDSLLLAASDTGKIIRVYGSLESAKAGTELEIRRLCGDSIACQSILPY